MLVLFFVALAVLRVQMVCNCLVMLVILEIIDAIIEKIGFLGCRGERLAALVSAFVIVEKNWV